LVDRVPVPGPARAPVIRHDVQDRGEAVEQKWRQEIYNRVKLGKAPTITLGEAVARYYETTLKPGAKPTKLVRDLAYRKQIKHAFGANRKLSEITQAEVAKWQDERVAEHGLAPSSTNRVHTVPRAIVKAIVNKGSR
jgi:hypothetical protein